MKFLKVKNMTKSRLVISQVRGADGRPLTFEAEGESPVAQNNLGHPALIPYLRSKPPQLVVLEEPTPDPVVAEPKKTVRPMAPPTSKPFVPAPAPKVEPAPAPVPEPTPEPAAPEPEPAPAPAPDAPETLSEAISDAAEKKTETRSSFKKKKR